MTKPELIAAYVSGRIGRRDFVRRLTALGVSATAAAAYAQSLTPGAAASGLGRTSSGLRVRAQDDEYVPPGFEDLIEVINLLLRILNVLLGILDGVGSFKLAPLRLQDGELDAADADQLDTLRTQLTAHSDALQTLLTDLGGEPEVLDTPALSYDAVDDALFDLQGALDTHLGLFAAAIPALADIEQTGATMSQTQRVLTTLSSISLVEARHAAFINRLLGDPEFPETFQAAASLDEVDATLVSLEG